MHLVKSVSLTVICLRTLRAVWQVPSYLMLRASSRTVFRLWMHWLKGVMLSDVLNFWLMGILCIRQLFIWTHGFTHVWWGILTSRGLSSVEQAFLVFCGCCLIHILMFLTKIMEVAIKTQTVIFWAMPFWLCIYRQLVLNNKSFLLLLIHSVFYLNWCIGDLFVDGKVVHRPQFWYNERQQTKNRPRPRYDRRTKTMQTQTREPFQRTWGQNPSESTQQTVSAEGHMSQTGGPSMNQGGSQA